MKKYMKSGGIVPWGAFGMMILLAAPTDLRAQGSLEGVVTNVSSLLGLSSNLTVNLKGLTGTHGSNTTAGIDYDYKRKVATNLLGSSQRFLDLDVHSTGFIALEARKSPHHLLSHGLRLSLENLWPDQLLTGAKAENARAVANKLFADYFITQWRPQQTIWKNDKDSVTGKKARSEMNRIVREANAYLAATNIPYKTVESDDENQFWYVSDPAGHRVPVDEVTAGNTVKASPLYLAWDLDGEAETDQTFSDVQIVGSTQLRAIIKPDWFDKPFAILRGYETPRDFRNRNAGPYFYGGGAIVDASNNDSRKAITGGTDEVFVRAHFGIGYRAELWALTKTSSLALELQWRYYHEFSAPAAIRQRNLDDTSYFKATLLFPGDVFVEYAEGKLPLDVESASTVSVGWRYKF